MLHVGLGLTRYILQARESSVVLLGSTEVEFGESDSRADTKAFLFSFTRFRIDLHRQVKINMGPMLLSLAGYRRNDGAKASQLPGKSTHLCK